MGVASFNRNPPGVHVFDLVPEPWAHNSSAAQAAETKGLAEAQKKMVDEPRASNLQEFHGLTHGPWAQLQTSGGIGRPPNGGRFPNVATGYLGCICQPHNVAGTLEQGDCQLALKCRGRWG